MKKIKCFAIIFVAFMLFLTSCSVSNTQGDASDSSSTPEATEHKHTYSKEWDFDEEGHWHKATCGHTDQTYSYSKHMWNEGVVTSEPTYDTEGITTYTCAVCGYEKTEKTDKLVRPHEHTYSAEWSSNADGHWHAATCEHSDNVKDYSEHIWDGGVVAADSSNGAEIKTYTCTVCQFKKTENMSNTESHVHSFSNEWSKDAEAHWHKSTCEHIDQISSYGEHMWDGGNITIEPTYDAKGVKIYTCFVCGCQKAEDIDKLVKPHEHTYSVEWSSNADGHWHVATCEHTDIIKGYAEHIWDGGVVTTDPTTEKEGVKTHTCTVCSYERYETLDKLKASYTLTFESEGMQTYSISIKYGETFSFPADENKGDNYTILRWIDKETGETVSSNIFSYTSNKTFVAVWGQEWSDNF